jgi:hypothetical protein
VFGVENVGERLLFRVEFLVLKGLFRLTKLVFHPSAFLNLEASCHARPKTNSISHPFR